jgi:hypothetical protein
MIKFLLTEDSIFIPDIKYTLSRENLLFEKTLKIVKSPDSQIEQLNFLVPVLNFESDLISIDHSGEKADIYYNGKYYKFPTNLLKTCIQLFKDETSITKKTIANFLLKILKNPNYSFKELWKFLEKHKFNFLDNGNILVYKKFEESDKKNKNRTFEQRKIKIEEFSEERNNLFYTIIEINPSEIIDGYIFNYKIKNVTDKQYLFNTYMKFDLFNAIFDILALEKENINLKLNNLLKIDIEKVFNKYQLELISNFTETYKKGKDLNYSIITRLCQ